MIDKNKKAVLEDIKAIKSFITGVLAFAVATAAFLVEVVNLPKPATLLGVSGVSVGLLVIGFLIQRSESRQAVALKAHVTASDKIVAEIHESMLEGQRSNLRTEMNLMMYTHPENHDTILKMAYRYFVELKGDWVETDLFLGWVEEEEAKGRRVHLPPELRNTVGALHAKEAK